MRRFMENAGKPWSRDEVEALKRLADGVRSTDEIARVLLRSSAAVALKASQERISLRVERARAAPMRKPVEWRALSAIL